MQSETQREAMIRARRFGSCAKCGGAQGHDYALGGVFCTNPKCGQDAPPADSAGLVERLRAVDISWSETGELCAEAAHHIAAQDAEIARLQAVMETLGKIMPIRAYDHIKPENG